MDYFGQHLNWATVPACVKASNDSIVSSEERGESNEQQRWASRSFISNVTTVSLMKADLFRTKMHLTFNAVCISVSVHVYLYLLYNMYVCQTDVLQMLDFSSQNSPLNKAISNNSRNLNLCICSYNFYNPLPHFFYSINKIPLMGYFS